MDHRTVLSALVLAALAIAVACPGEASDARDRSAPNGAPATSPGAGPARPPRAAVRDAWLTAKTKIALFADERVKSGQVRVETADGAVTLRGKVDTPEARAAAIAVARQIDGVRHVRSDLHVVPPGERARVDATDKDITRRVENGLSRDRELRDVEARTDRRVVILTGAVPGILASARASELARSVPGVRSVRNELQHEPGSGRRERSLLALMLLAAMGRKVPAPAGGAGAGSGPAAALDAGETEAGRPTGR